MINIKIKVYSYELKKINLENYANFLEQLKPRLEEQFNYIQSNGYHRFEHKEDELILRLRQNEDKINYIKKTYLDIRTTKLISPLHRFFRPEIVNLILKENQGTGGMKNIIEGDFKTIESLLT